MGKKTVKVLLIEDSEADARLIREMFSEPRRISFELVWADLLQKGLQYLETDSFDVVLLDLHLPDSYGVTTLGVVRAKAPDMPIVVLTSFNDEVRAVSAVREGAENYIVKGQVDGILLTRSLLHAIEHKRAMVSLQAARDELEVRVQERTAELTQTIETLKKAEQNIHNLNRLYRMLGEINQTIIRIQDRDQLLNEICRVAVEYGKFCMAWIGFIDAEERMVRPVAHSGMEQDYLNNICIAIDDVPKGCGPTGRAVREGRCIVCSDIQNDPRMAPWRDEALRRGYCSSASVPIRNEDSVIGAFTVYACEPYFFDEEETKLLEEIGMDISFALNAIEKESLRKQAEDGLRDSKERLGFLSSRLLTAYEEERKRISREVHDVITSSLGAILLSQKNTIHKLDKEEKEAAKEAMERAIAMTQETIRESRRIINDLRPPMLDDLGLITTVSWLSRQFTSVYPATVLNQQIEVTETDVPEKLKIVIFRIAQEAFTNIGKYSQAQTALLTLRKGQNCLELCITDNGIGFNVQDTLAKRDAEQGLGLISMKERADLSGGTLAIESVPGKGTTIRATWQATIT